MIPKEKRWESKDYIKFVSEMACSACGIKDGTVVAHHCKVREFHMGGTGRKPSDLFVMPLCYECHHNIHNGDKELVDSQAMFIFRTLEKALQHDIISIKYKPYEYNVL